LRQLPSTSKTSNSQSVKRKENCQQPTILPEEGVKAKLGTVKFGVWPKRTVGPLYPVLRQNAGAQGIGRVVSSARLGGLHYRYYRDA
jgi:hypothetical protein